MSTVQNTHIPPHQKLLRKLLCEDTDDREEDWGEAQGQKDYYEFFRVHNETTTEDKL